MIPEVHQVITFQEKQLRYYGRMMEKYSREARESVTASKRLKEIEKSYRRTQETLRLLNEYKRLDVENFQLQDQLYRKQLVLEGQAMRIEELSK